MGEDIKKWRETILVLKNNMLFLYKNDTVSMLENHDRLGKNTYDGYWLG